MYHVQREVRLYAHSLTLYAEGQLQCGRGQLTTVSIRICTYLAASTNIPHYLPSLALATNWVPGHAPQKTAELLVYNTMASSVNETPPTQAPHWSAHLCRWLRRQCKHRLQKHMHSNQPTKYSVQSIGESLSHCHTVCKWQNWKLHSMKRWPFPQISHHTTLKPLLPTSILLLGSAHITSVSNNIPLHHIITTNAIAIYVEPLTIIQATYTYLCTFIHFVLILG